MIGFNFYSFVLTSFQDTQESFSNRDSLNYRIDEQFEIISAQYVSHDPIMIDGNNDFITRATTEGWPGDGTLSSPYIIEKFSISGSPGRNMIEIRGTNVYFRIQHCSLWGGELGISLTKVENGYLSNNIIYDNHAGIVLWDSSNYNVIINNNVHSSNVEGIGLHFSNNNIITGNTVYKNQGGILLWESTSFNTVINNSAYSNNVEGIGLHAANNNIVTGNTVYDNDGGFTLWEYSSYNEIINNSAYSNNEGIICLDSASDNQLVNNTISFNSLGISIHSSSNSIDSNNFYYNHGEALGFEPGSSYNIVEGNNFINNYLGAYNSHQAYDEGYRNVFEYNYWGDWTTPDVNDDGIVDNPYTIDGGANNQDTYPLTTLSKQTSFHALFLATIIYPNGGTLEDAITIQWVSSNDTLDHLVAYSVYYSSDSGKSWNLLASGLTATIYDWNTSTVFDGSTYLIKVVVTCSEGLIMEDVSNGTFSIKNTGSFLDLLTPLAIIAIIIILVITVLIVGFLSLRKVPSKIEEPVVQKVPPPMRPDIQVKPLPEEPTMIPKFPKPVPAVGKKLMMAKPAILKEILKLKVLERDPVDPLVTPDFKPSDEATPVTPSIKPVDEDKKSLFSSIQYQVQDLIFEQDDTGLIARLIPYSGSIKEIIVEFKQNQIIMSGCLQKEKFREWISS